MIIVRDNVPYEGIISLKSEKGYYATPIGFTIRGNNIYIKVYHGSLTHSYLSTIRKTVLNITDNPYIYLYLAFKKEFNGLNKVSFIEVEDNAPVLEEAKAYAILYLRDIIPCLNYDTFIYNYDTFVTRNPDIEPLSRCNWLAIEALIYLTKLFKIRDSGVEVSDMKTYLNHVFRIMERLCNDPYHKELVNNLFKLYISISGNHNNNYLF
ncbi:MAG: DUF447 family protein [Desulfurococcaceae archaeon]